MMLKEFEALADWCLQVDHIDTVDIKSNFHNLLKIRIEDNYPVVVGGDLSESRQFSIFRMIVETCKRFKVENLTLVYCTSDRSNYSTSVFSHARLRGQRNLLAPCFTFDSYEEGPQSLVIKYEDTYNRLITSHQLTWSEKKDTCIFVGHVGNNNNRLHNTSVYPRKTNLLVHSQQASSENFIQREYLSNFRYLLHLNGNGGAYASRFKYLLGAGGTVFYNFNSGRESNFWEEWWMKPDFFQANRHYIPCFDREEFIYKIDNISDEDASVIATNGFDYFKKYLSKENVLLFWSILLNKYANKLA